MILCCFLVFGLTGCSNRGLKEKDIIGTVWFDNNDYNPCRYEFYKANMAKMISVGKNGNDGYDWDMLWKIEKDILVLSYADGEIYDKYELSDDKTKLIAISGDETLTKS